MHSSKLSLSINIQLPNGFSFAGGINVRDIYKVMT